MVAEAMRSNSHNQLLVPGAYGLKLGKEEADSIVELLKMGHIKEFRLEGPNLDGHLVPIVEAGDNLTLLHLSLVEMPKNPSLYAAILDLVKRSSNLTTLILSSCKLPSILDDLCDALKEKKSVTTLDIGYGNTKIPSMQKFFELPFLKKLVLKKNRLFYDHELKPFCEKLAENTTLEELDVEGCDMEQKRLELFLKTCGKHPSLKKINIDSQCNDCSRGFIRGAINRTFKNNTSMEEIHAWNLL